MGGQQSLSCSVPSNTTRSSVLHQISGLQLYNAMANQCCTFAAITHICQCYRHDSLYKTSVCIALADRPLSQMSCMQVEAACSLKRAPPCTRCKLPAALQGVCSNSHTGVYVSYLLVFANLHAASTWLFYGLKRAPPCSCCRISQCLLGAPAATTTQASARPALSSCVRARMTCPLPHICMSADTAVRCS